MYIYIYIYKQRSYVGEHEILPNGIFIELYLGFHLIKVYIYVKILVR